MSSATQRLSRISHQLHGKDGGKSSSAHIFGKSPSDVHVRQASAIKPNLVEEIVVGNLLHKDAPFVTRASALAAGYPATTAISTVSRWCSSGLLAVEAVAQKAAVGSINIGIAVGAERMSCNPNNGAPVFPSRFMEDPTIQDVTQPMPWTAENVARDFGITRERQDEQAAASFCKAEATQKAGFFADEIVPIATSWIDPKSGEVRNVLAEYDDGIHYGTTKQALSKVRSAFPQWPPTTTTGGNAAQITDGAAALLYYASRYS
ncbi:hypothetical protein MRS44_008455 [Fusarium solani]|uniref:uncharacterized protein n=1 Tax=Fusarium solani TaxID=169388 RepID=UPI0032C49AEC|nr:hypothetical protein MRS44_008455 [Fusarium solani]